MANEPVIAPPRSWADRRWALIPEFRGTPDTSPQMWWWNDLWGNLEIDRAILGADGEIVGKGGCGADSCTHVMLVQEGDLPPEPTDRQ